MVGWGSPILLGSVWEASRDLEEGYNDGTEGYKTFDRSTAEGSAQQRKESHRDSTIVQKCLQHHHGKNQRKNSWVTRDESHVGVGGLLGATQLCLYFGKNSASSRAECIVEQWNMK